MPRTNLHAVAIDAKPSSPPQALTSTALEAELVHLEKAMRDACMTSPTEADRIAGEIERCQIKLRTVRTLEAEAAQRAEAERQARERAERDAAATAIVREFNTRAELDELIEAACTAVRCIATIERQAPAIASRNAHGLHRIDQTKGQAQPGYYRVPIGGGGITPEAVANIGDNVPGLYRTEQVLEWIQLAVANRMFGGNAQSHDAPSLRTTERVLVLKGG